MQPPIQAPPQPRYFMQLIVGREWNPEVDEVAGQVTPRRGVRNPSLLQLTTFSQRSGSLGARQECHGDCRCAARRP